MPPCRVEDVYNAMSLALNSLFIGKDATSHCGSIVAAPSHEHNTAQQIDVYSKTLYIYRNKK